MDGSIVGIVGLLAIVFGWGSFRRRQEIGKVKRQPALVQVDGREYRVTFRVEAVSNGWPGPPAHIITTDTMHAAIDGRSGDGWQHLGDRPLPFNVGYSGHAQPRLPVHMWAGLLADTVSARLW